MINCRRLLVLVPAVLVSVAIFLMARADPGNGSSSSVGGSEEQYIVKITYRGDVKGSVGNAVSGGRQVSVPAPVKCWWTPVGASYTDPQATYEWYLAMLSAQSTSQYASEHLGSDQDYQFVINEAKKGHKYYWYFAVCLNDEDLAGFTKDSVGSVTRVKAFEVIAGKPTVPEPRVDPEQVAIEATKVLNLVDPVMERNPRVDQGSRTGLTLVNIPTWFWVTNQEALGGATGTRRVTVKVTPPSGNTTSVTVTARTQGLELTSPGAPAVSCPVSRASLAWAKGLGEDDGCTMRFSRASVGYPQGYPVTAAVTWAATWQVDKGPSQPVPNGTRNVSTTVPVPVAEIQTVVTDVH